MVCVTHDNGHALGVKSVPDVWDELENLVAEHPDEQSTNAIRLIQPILGHYERFAKDFVAGMAHLVDMAMM